MFKKILQASAQALLSRPKIIRLAFFTLLCFSIVRLYYIIYYFNTILIWKYESGVQVSDALMYFISTLHAHHAVGTIIIAVLIIIVGYLWLYPIGQASVILLLVRDWGGFFRCLNIEDFPSLLVCLPFVR